MSDLKTILSIVLSLPLLFSQVGIFVHTHLCGGKIADVEFIAGTELSSCGMENEINPCVNYPATAINKIPCCGDELKSFNTDNFLPVIKLIPVSFDVILITLPEFFNFASFSQFIPSIPYSPPPGLTSVSLPFIQSFLI